MKKVLLFILCSIFFLTMAGCDKKEEKQNNIPIENPPVMKKEYSFKMSLKVGRTIDLNEMYPEDAKSYKLVFSTTSTNASIVDNKLTALSKGEIEVIIEKYDQNNNLVSTIVSKYTAE